MGFVIYDLILLAAFVIFFSIFLYTRKHNLKKEGLLFIYRTSWGMKAIDAIGKKNPRFLKAVSYISIFCGFALMVGALYLVYSVIQVYLFHPDVVRAIKVPPILPLVPYVPQAFKLSFLPPFYFTYWIVILAIIAITHEMAHGILMRRYGIRIKSTGFAFFPTFFPVFPAAFVEQDEKSMNKAGKFEQMAVLSAGTFANVLTAILFLGVLWVFFSTAFTASGVVFDSYATSGILVGGITAVNGIPLQNSQYGNIINLTNSDGLTEIIANNKTYLVNKEILEKQIDNAGEILVYDSAPAIRNNLSSIILSINEEKITSIDLLASELSKYKPGDEVIVETKSADGSGSDFKTITLEENPSKPGNAWLGIGFIDKTSPGIIGRTVGKLASFKEQGVYYMPRFDGISIFLYNLVWWTILISVSVAFMNMLPVGIFDGGRFFYLTVLGLTKNKKIAERAFKISTSLFLFILVAIMVFWAWSWF